ncbi:DUF1636 family protein [Nodosilinea sp. AN01ver1]|uniref:DUF1636 family protein n=1 Tax=Nodosilinea sp. AN01ver1 TaxID=3423362 RepID=UPI003D3137D6
MGFEHPLWHLTDLDPATCAADLLTAAELYLDSDDGRVPCFKLPDELQAHRTARILPAP